ncbi:Bipolar DNA helicase [Liberibacter crescens BT-1]|uniref:Bipolar DNA helicase n=1 Tax=Liberibacter crescens (strain BT-1) TaxID=1215343 RepID=L0EUT3_LIBCB|nr:ATP-binding protein [Liberibacter crescens]AGA64722.1 Bipolar DNA helicase [Liberibacter crescens BT-1]
MTYIPNHEHQFPDLQNDKKTFGKVIACSGAFATISILHEENSEQWQVGCLISIIVEENMVIALINSMETQEQPSDENSHVNYLVHVELMGELNVNQQGIKDFSRGISLYPPIGAMAYRITSDDMRSIYNIQEEDTCVIGKMSHDHTIDVAININSILSRHFAIVGSTGSGKSTAASLLLHKAIQHNPRLRIVILDPHSEFANAFQDMSIKITINTLKLPFWLMRLEEFCEVLFRGKKPVPEEVDVLYSLIPECKKMFSHHNGDTTSSHKRHIYENLTADTPIPYRISDLLKAIEERIGKLEGRNERPFLKALRIRILSAINDPLYHFLFPHNTINDCIIETISHIFRVDDETKPICVLELSEISAEIINPVVSVLCRMAFEIAAFSNNTLNFLIICEEAHRYIPANPDMGFFPTQQAIGRIAREGRKYGCYLGIISQQPSEIDKTILSQCSTIFAMRLTNSNDHDIIRSCIPNSSLSKIEILSSIANREAIAFGEGITIPMQIRFLQVPKDQLPNAFSISKNENLTSMTNKLNLNDIVDKMRGVIEKDVNPKNTF